ncbi:hypothetical protein Vretimale_17189, partial [Volvox reticuliferus]
RSKGSCVNIAAASGTGRAPCSPGLANLALDSGSLPFPDTQVLDSFAVIWPQCHGESALRGDLVAPQAHGTGCSGASYDRSTEPSFSGFPRGDDATMRPPPPLLSLMRTRTPKLMLM